MRTLKDVAPLMADIIDARGHAVGTYCNGSREFGSVCVLGALNIALRGEPYPPPLYSRTGVDDSHTDEWNEYEKLADELAVHLNPGEDHFALGHVVKWSDSTKPADIISTLRGIK